MCSCPLIWQHVFNMGLPVAWQCSYSFSKLDIFVAGWSITDSFCCIYPRIFYGREVHLRGRVIICLVAVCISFVSLQARQYLHGLLTPLGSSRMERGQSTNPHLVHLAFAHVGKCSRAYEAAVRCSFLHLWEPLLFLLPLTPAAVAAALAAMGGLQLNV